ncbi:MAG: ATP synthase F1 subunit delta [Candidatus Andersenbacteria bacterium]|nr:ATP synthase F1 subunit delta [Candidatus Andersenbacteria bacterium]
MKITPKQYAISLYESTIKVDNIEVEKRIRKFVDILKRNNDLSLVDKIIEKYYEHYRDEKNISKIEITSNEKINPEILNKIIQKFKKQIEIEEKIDGSLVGGMVIKIDDSLLIDGSVKRKLENLKKNLV